jgi:hypothetical protein
MNDIYKDKYLKYKLKYNNLKKIINGGGSDGMNNTGSLNFQLHIKNSSPIYNKLIYLLTKIDRRLDKIKLKSVLVDREFHISLFTIVYNKDLPYTQTPEFQEKINLIQTKLDCLTQKYIEQNFIENIKLNLHNEFHILGTKEFSDSFITQTIIIDEITKKIFSNLKKNICLYLFGKTFYIDSDNTHYINLEKETSYYYKNNKPLYKIKKIYNFDKTDYKCHISYSKLNGFLPLVKTSETKYLSDIVNFINTQNKKDIEDTFFKLYDDTKIDESFINNYEFKISVIN